MFLDDVIRSAVRDVMREVLEPIIETPAFQGRLAEVIAQRSGQLLLKPVAAEAVSDAVPEPDGAPTPPWTVGTGPGRRLTDAGRAHLQVLLDEGKAAAEIAAELGVSQRTVHGLSATAPAPKVPQVERDATRAEKVRAYQREWTRKRRAMKAAAGEAKAPAVPEARTVVVVPAAEVPAPRQPASPSLSSLVLPAPLPAAPAKPKPAPQVIATTAKEVRAWLIASMKASGLTLIQAQDRVGFMTHDQVLADANQRRLRAGMPPFAFLGARSAA